MSKRKLDDSETNSCNFLKRINIAVEEPSEENVIRYYLMPSLEHLTAVKIVITLWSRADIRDEVIKLCGKVSKEWRRGKIVDEKENMNELGREIKNKILQLSEFDVIRKILSDLVDRIGQEIFDWIEYQDRHVLRNYFLDKDVARSYLDGLVWTSRGIIDYKETAKVLIGQKQLQNIHNCYIACTYCLESDIAKFMRNILFRICWINNLSNYSQQNVMVHFWSVHLPSIFTKLAQDVYCYNKKYNIEYSINEYIFRVLACSKSHRNNQVAIKYMWNTLSYVEKMRQILSVMEYSTTDIKCFFLSQMNETQQQYVFKARSREMLLCLLDDWLWKDYFLPTMHHVWNIIPALDFLLVVEDIVVCRMGKHYEDVGEYNRYRGILKELWRSAPKHLKEFIFEFQNGSRGSGIFFGLLCARNVDIIQLMLPDVNDGQKKNLISSSPSNCSKCYWLIINDQMDVVKMFIDSSLFPEYDVGMFKYKLVESHGCDIAVLFIQNQKWDGAEEFVRWAFKRDHDRMEFKAKLTYGKICDDILERVAARNNAGGFVELADFFQWCASGSTREFLDIKREMYRVYFTKLHCRLIEEDKYQLLEEFINWCFPNNKREVESIRRCFYCFYECISVEQREQIVELVLNLVEKDDQLQSLEKFIRWCFTRKREIANYKRWMLEPGRNDAESVCIKLLRKGMFRLADEVVHWCCNSSQVKISKFKSKLMLWDDIESLFEHSHDGKKLEKVLKWFDPSIELIIRFRKKFDDFRWLEDYDVAAHFIRNQKWNEVDQFIWIFKSDDNEKREFKAKIACSKIGDDILESIVANNDEGGFVELDNFFQWCAMGSTQRDFEIKREIFKEGLYERYFTEAIFCQLIEDDKHQLLEQILKWFYSINERQVGIVKRSFHRNFKYIQIVQLILNLVEKNNKLQSLEKFVRWCFTLNQEIDSFKKWILKPVREDIEGVSIKLLNKGMFELADEFVHWCCNSSQIEVTKFKNKLMLCDQTEYLFTRSRHDVKTLKKLMKWCNPSEEVKIQFRKKIIFAGLKCACL